MSSIVQKGAQFRAASATSFTPSITGVTAHNSLLMVAVVSQNAGNAPVPIDSSGQTWQLANATTPNGPCGYAVFYLLDANAGTHNLTWSPTGGTWGVCEIVETVPLTAFDLAGTHVSTTTSSPTTVSGITTTGTTGLLIGIMGLDGNAGNASLGISDPPTGFTSIDAYQDSTTYIAGEWCYKDVTAGASGSISWAYSTTDTGQTIIGQLVAFTKAPGVPTINTQPTDQTVNEGSTATFTVSATASAGSLTYQWQDNSSGSFSNIGGATTSSYTTGGASFSMQQRQYQCVVTDSNGNVTTSAATLRVAYRVVGTGPRPLLGLGHPFGAGSFGTFVQGSVGPALLVMSEAGSATDVPSAVTATAAAVAEAVSASETINNGQPIITVRQYWRQLVGETTITLQGGYTNPMTLAAGSTLFCAVSGYYGPSTDIPYPTLSSGTLATPSDPLSKQPALTGTRGFCHKVGAVANVAGGSVTTTPPSTTNGNQVAIWLFEVTNMPSTLSCIDSASAQSSATTLTWSIGSGSGVKKGHLVIAFGSYDGSNGSITTGGLGAPSGFTQIAVEDTAGNLYSPAELAYMIPTADGAVTPSWTTTDTSKDYDLAIVVTFAPSGLGSSYSVGVTEAGTGADATSASAADVAAVSEAATGADTTSNTFTTSATVSEAGAGADTTSQALNTPAAVSEAGTGADSASASAADVAAVAEAATGTDTTSNTFTTSAAVTEAGTAADATSNTFSTPAAVSEAATGADTTSEVVSTAVSLGESGTAADTSSTSGAGSVTVAEAGSAADVTANTFTTTATVSEVGTGVDTASGATSTSVSATEAGVAAETSTAGTSASSAVAENGTATDSEAATAVEVAAIAEAVTAVELADQGGNITNAAVGEAGTGADTVSSVSADVASVQEVGTAADVPSAAAVFHPSVSEAGAAADQPNSTMATGVAVGEAGSAADTTAQGASTSVSVSEQATAVDTTDASRIAGAIIGDVLNAVDASGATAVWALQALDNGDAVDAASVTAVLWASLAELADAEDSGLDVLLTFGLTIEELANAVDSRDWHSTASTLVRVYKFGLDTRNYNFPVSPRAYTFGIAPRSYTFPSSSQGYNFSVESRAYTFPASSRSYTFPETR